MTFASFLLLRNYRSRSSFQSGSFYSSPFSSASELSSFVSMPVLLSSSNNFNCSGVNSALKCRFDYSSMRSSRTFAEIEGISFNPIKWDSFDWLLLFFLLFSPLPPAPPCANRIFVPISSWFSNYNPRFTRDPNHEIECYPSPNYSSDMHTWIEAYLSESLNYRHPQLLLEHINIRVYSNDNHKTENEFSSIIIASSRLLTIKLIFLPTFIQSNISLFKWSSWFFSFSYYCSASWYLSYRSAYFSSHSFIIIVIRSVIVSAI